MDPQLHLFVDDHDIRMCARLQRVLNRPLKHPAPVLVADQPWEGDRVQAWGSVIREPDGLLRMYYFGFNGRREPGTLDCGGYCYAESRDGIHWEKPPLGLVRWRGSTRNNLFYTFAPDGEHQIDAALARAGKGLPAFDHQANQLGIVNNMDGLTVVKDDDDPDPTRRYKLFANMQDHRMWALSHRDLYPDVTEEQVQVAHRVMGQYVLTSADGIHFSREPRRMIGAVGGDYMMVQRDHRNARWWLNERPAALGGQYTRSAALRTSTDLVRWTEPAETIFTNGPESGFGQQWEWHGGLTPFNYGTLDLGFLERWHNSGFGDGCELVSHRDGQRWQRPFPGVDFLQTGSEGSFDRALTYPTHNPPIRVGDRLHIYYTGAGVRSDRLQPLPMSIGLATIGLDRFAGLAHSRGEPGRLLTTPLKVEDNVLRINIEPTHGGSVRVAIQSPDLVDIPGYGVDECQPAAGDCTDHVVRWKQRPDLSPLRGRTVLLLFEVTGHVLYGFRGLK